MKFDTWDALLISLVSFYLILAPYTKVEESFNIQAIHDIVFYGFHVEKFDHVEFPGAVPRTFLGALAIALPTKICHFLFPSIPKFSLQLIARAFLGMLNIIAWTRFKRALAKVYGSMRGRTIGSWYTVLTLCQFHTCYYLTRTLPNMFAFPLVLVAYCWVLEDHLRAAVALLAFTATIFRVEIAALAASVMLCCLFHGRISLRGCVLGGLFGATIGATMSIVVDSYFWQTFPMLPELNTFIFNVVQGQSSLWGVEPYNYYFTRHLPRLMGNPALSFFSVGALFLNSPKRIRLLYFATVLYIAICSFQPHKEWRFVIYVVPVWTAMAAHSTDFIWIRCKNRLSGLSIAAGILCMTMASLCVSLMKANVSSMNYPGGKALSTFHNLHPPESTSGKTIHLDVLTCMTGVTRFTQEREDLVYDKTEMPDRLEAAWPNFDFYIGEKPPVDAESWQLDRAISAFDSLNPRVLLSTVLDFESTDSRLSSIVLPLLNPKIFWTRLKRAVVQTVVTRETLFIYRRGTIKPKGD